MNPDLEPLAVYDVREPNWNNLTLDNQQAIRDWAPTQGIDLTDAVRLEIHVIDCLVARITEWERGPDGAIRVCGGEPQRARPFDVLINAMPPVQPSTNEGGTHGPSH